MVEAAPHTKLSVIIPSYNERGTILTILAKLIAAPKPVESLELIIVNDGSSDGTREILDTLGTNPSSILSPHFDHIKASNDARKLDKVEFKTFHHESNQGKSSAIRSGIEAITGDIAMIQDADLEYDPLDIATLLKPILQAKADVVYGSRFQGSSRRVLYFWNAVGNRIITTLSNFVSNLNLTDVMTGYKAFRADILKALSLRSEGFGFELEITAKVARLNLRIYEVPISYFGRSYVDGKKVRWWHGIMAILQILRHFLFPGRALKPEFTQLEALEDLFAVNTITDHTYERVRKMLGSKILEVGSGIGNMTAFLLRHGEVTGSDISTDALNKLQAKFGDRSNLRVQQWDLADPFSSDEKFDTVVCINVLEHIEDDREGLRNIIKVLKPGGTLVLLVPQGMWLYGPFDKKIGHYRRYHSKGLKELLTEENFEIKDFFNFNALGVPGWWFNAKVMRKDTLGRSMLRIYNLISPPCLWLERQINPPFGLSFIAECTHPGEPEAPRDVEEISGATDEDALKPARATS